MDNKTASADVTRKPEKDGGELPASLVKEALDLLGQRQEVKAEAPAAGEGQQRKDAEEKPATPGNEEKRAISIGADQFTKLDQEGAALLKEHKVSKITILPKGERDLIVAELEKPLDFPLDPAGGCRKVSIAPKIAAEFKQNADGTMELSNIRGITAEVDPGKDPLLGVPLPWVTANLSKIALTKGQDGKFSVEVTGGWGNMERTTTVPLAEDQVDRIRGVLANVAKLRESGDTQLAASLSEEQLLQGVPAQKNQLTDSLVDVLLYAAGGAAALKLAHYVAGRAGLIGRGSKTEGQTGAPPDAKPEAGAAKPGTAAKADAAVAKPEPAAKTDVAAAKPAGPSTADAAAAKPSGPSTADAAAAKSGASAPASSESRPRAEAPAMRPAVPVANPEALRGLRATTADTSDRIETNRQGKSAYNPELPQTELERKISDLVQELRKSDKEWPNHLEVSKSVSQMIAAKVIAEKADKDTKRDIETALGEKINRTEYYDPTIMQEKLKEHPDLWERYLDADRKMQKLIEAKGAVEAKLQAPIAKMQDRVNQVLDKMGLPQVKLDIDTDFHSEGSAFYRVGKGKIGYNPRQMLRGGERDAVELTAHELKHAEQDRAVIRWMASEQNGGKPLTEDDKTKVQERYNREVGHTLDRDWLNKVLESPDALKVSADERARAEKLAESFRAGYEVKLEQYRLRKESEHLEEALDYVKDPKRATELIDMLRNQDVTGGLCKKLFGTEELPKPVADLVRLRNQIDARQAPASAWQDAAAKKTLVDEISNRRSALERESTRKYRNQYHEQEAFSTGALALQKSDLQGDQLVPAEIRLMQDILFSGSAQVLKDFRSEGGPKTETGKMLLKFLSPSGSETAAETEKAMKEAMGAKADSVLTKWASDFADGHVTSDTVTTLKKMIGATNAADFYKKLASMSTDARLNLHQLACGKDPAVNGKNVDALIDKVTAGTGKSFLEIIAQKDDCADFCRMAREISTEAPSAVPIPAPGERAKVEGRDVTVSAVAGDHVVVHNPNAAAPADLQEISADELKAKYEAIKVQVDGKEQTRYFEKGHPEKGLYLVTDLAGQKNIARDTKLEVVASSKVTAPVTPSPSAGNSSASNPEAVADDKLEFRRTATPERAPERGAAPTPERLGGARVEANADGTLKREGTTVGDTFARELSRQERISEAQIGELKQELERLEKDPKEKERAEKLRQTVDALEGKYGREVQLEAHRGMIEAAARHAREGRWSTGKALGTFVGVSILACAALGWLAERSHSNPEPLRRAKVSGR